MAPAELKKRIHVRDEEGRKAGPKRQNNNSVVYIKRVRVVRESGRGIFLGRGGTFLQFVADKYVHVYVHAKSVIFLRIRRPDIAGNAAANTRGIYRLLLVIWNGCILLGSFRATYESNARGKRNVEERRGGGGRWWPVDERKLIY